MLILSLWAVTAGHPVSHPGSRETEPRRLPLDAVLEHIQRNYDRARTFKARFSQKNTSAAFGRSRTVTGQLAFKKPGRMRWEYDPPESKLFLAIGQTLWMYEPGDKQAYKQDLKQSQLPAALSVLLGKGRLRDEFEIALAGEITYGKPTDYRLWLRPKKPRTAYKSIYFIVDPRTFYVTEAVLINSLGDVNDMLFSDVKLDEGVLDSLFKWEPPAGTHVIDGNR
jgi:outer membrane lipoprotein carrier protein